MRTAGNNEKEKRAYGRPSLTVYGSVRDLTGNNSGLTTGDAGTMMILGSDPAYKQNTVLVDQHPAGFGLYLFDYKPGFRDIWGHGRKFGVMADEVEKIVPEAIVVTANGYRAVNYTQLGITLH